MKIVLRDDVENLGTKGDIVEVKDGYARNYLVPRGFAMKASAGVVKQAEAMRRNRQLKEAKDREAANAQATALASRTIQVTARAGEGGRLFGSITTSDIAAAITAAFGIEIDRRKIDLDEPLKELGTAEIRIKVFADIEATLTLDVVAE